MKPISVKIEAFGPYTAEQTAEAFQKYCFSRDIGWPEFKVFYAYEVLYTIEEDKGRFELDWVREVYEGHEEFTLPSEWKAFTEYLDKYIAYHSKPEPEIGKYWYHGLNKSVSRIDTIHLNGCVGHTIPSGIEEYCASSHFERPATPEEIKQYKEDSLISEAKRRYKEGDKVRGVDDRLIQQLTTKRGVSSHDIDNRFWFDGGTLWHYGVDLNVILHREGKWAEVIKEEPIPTPGVTAEEFVRAGRIVANHGEPSREEDKHNYSFSIDMANGNTSIFLDGKLVVSEREQQLEEMVKQLIKRIEDSEDAKQDNFILNEAVVNAAENILNKKP